MARRPRVFAAGLLYHVIVRGNQRQKTFLSNQDYQAYLARLAKYQRRYGVLIYAYCLMPNHVHMLLESSNEPLSRFMQGLQQSYTQYFNHVHRKVGHLFQGRYKAIVCEKEGYLLTLIRYIHLNPVRARLVQKPEQYQYSGHGVYLRGEGTEVLDPASGLEWFGGQGAYRRFVLDGIKEGHQEEYYELADQRFLGSEGFGKKVKDRLGEETERVMKRPLGRVLKELAGQVHIDPEVLRGPDRGWEVSKGRTLVAYVLVRRLGFGVSAVAAYIRRDAATVSSLLSRLSDRMQTDRQISKEVDRLAKIV